MPSLMGARGNLRAMSTPVKKCRPVWITDAGSMDRVYWSANGHGRTDRLGIVRPNRCPRRPAAGAARLPGGPGRHGDELLAVPGEMLPGLAGMLAIRGGPAITLDEERKGRGLTPTTSGDWSGRPVSLNLSLRPASSLRAS